MASRSKSMKMYLTIFLATTCIYMILYQYHVSWMTEPEIPKNNKDITSSEVSGMGNAKDKIFTLSPTSSSSSSLVKRYNLFLWSPMSLFSTQQKPQAQLNKVKDKPTKQHAASTISSSTTTTTATTTTTTSLLLSSTTTKTELVIAKTTNATTASVTKSLISPASSSSLSSLSSTLSSATAPLASTALNASSADARKKQISNIVVATNFYNTNNSSLNSTNSLKQQQQQLEQKSHLHNRTVTNSLNNNSTINSTITTATTTTTTTTNSTRTTTPPPLYIITPTYRRSEQLAELTRLGYTLKHVDNLLWLVVEDANTTSPLVIKTLNRIGVPYEYYLAPMPDEYKQLKKSKPRGVSNRNRGLQWLRANATEGVFYFADDDNTYDISIFKQMRYTKKVSMWPVGLVTKLGVSTPIIRNGKIDGFYDGWIGGRKFPVDMAGFAVSVKFLHERPNAKMPFKPGYEEDGFLKSLAPLNTTEIELLASNCTEILTWHTQSKKNPNAEVLNMTKYSNTNLELIDKTLVRS